MKGVGVDRAFLRTFESGLDPRRPEDGPIPVRIIGHGEITTVLEMRLPGDDAGVPGGMTGRAGVACKRMPMFRSAAEVSAYDLLYAEYERVLRDEIGLDVAESALVWLPPVPAGADGGTTILYIVQELLAPSTVGHVRLRDSGEQEARALLGAALREMDKVFAFNEANRGRLEVGFDGQISNWAVVESGGREGGGGESGGGSDPVAAAGAVGAVAGPPADQAREGHSRASGPPARLHLRYLDTSTPLLRRDGREQLEPELFLRAAPSFLVWIIRRFMLADVMERYYDRRKVAVDLVANLFKEQRPDLVPVAVELVNGFLASADAAPVTEEEVRAYYREDARIWRVYLAFRKIDRLLHRLLRKEYPYILPGRVVR